MLLRILLLLIVSVPHFAIAQERMVQIGLLRDRTVKKVVVMGDGGKCDIHIDGVKKGELKASDGLRIETAENGMSARSLSASYRARRSIEIIPQDEGGFRMKATDHPVEERPYSGSLKVQRSKTGLLLVDRVPLEDYIGGVIQAEAGKRQHFEYYKLQAVSCRTYALSNLRKHQGDGFQLCDGVHCQVYHGITEHDTILQAIDATRGLVLVDADIRLIHSTFHSNCGGETVNAEEVWSKSEPYLRAITDTFCLAAPHSSWSRSLTRAEWLGYLKKKFSLLPQPDQLEALLNYEPSCRDLYLGNTWPLVPLKQVREDLKLNSTFFSVRTKGDEVLLEGRGFGHGVGLCQEGSMRMARSGRSYIDILHHYYSNVHLVDLSTLDFFRDRND